LTLEGVPTARAAPDRSLPAVRLQSTGLDVLHCVVFPDPAAVGRDVPMFGCDLVAVKGQITAAIVDLSPVTKEKVLADDYVAEFDRRAAPLVQFSSPRELPEFGKAIFSDRCQFIRPEGKEEESRFVKLCGEILALHCELAEKRLADKHDAVDVQEAVEGQTFYCQKQSENDKTRRILVQAFGAEWTDRYMSEVLFDEPPASP
jgi:phycocyanobilin:ferredoxin oxidoreductase